MKDRMIQKILNEITNLKSNSVEAPSNRKPWRPFKKNPTTP